MLSFSVFSLLTLAACSIGKNAPQKYAFAFVLSVILVKPIVFSQSATLSCCFIIAFLAMLCVPQIYRAKQYIFPFFMIVGMLTQFFDFYISPVITLCYPLLYLLLLWNNDPLPVGTPQSLVLKAGGMWLFGYAFMWLSKLGLTTLFTDVNSVFEGLSSFLARMGLLSKETIIAVYPMADDFSYSIFDMFFAIAKAIFESRKWLLLYASAAAALALIAIVCVKQKKLIANKPDHHVLSFLIVALLPILWLCATAQPSNQHAWFQYRCVCAVYFGLFCAVLLCFSSPEEEK